MKMNRPRWLSRKNKTVQSDAKPHKRDAALYSVEWIDYINSETKAFCESKAWKLQIRRKWCVREQPVANDRVSHLEWKLLPPEQPHEKHGEIEGNYYLLAYEYERHLFRVQHSTVHVGMTNPSHFVETFSEIRVPTDVTEYLFANVYFNLKDVEPLHPDGIPPDGWLRGHLHWLTGKFSPNRFWYT